MRRRDAADRFTIVPREEFNPGTLAVLNLIENARIGFDVPVYAKTLAKSLNRSVPEVLASLVELGAKGWIETLESHDDRIRVTAKTLARLGLSSREDG